MGRRDLVRTTASVQRADGTWLILGEFRSFSGGELTSADIKAVRGAGQAERARGGRQTVGNVTVAREDDGAVDLKYLATRRGKAAMTVTRTPLDDDGNVLSAGAITYTGKLMRVGPGEGDASADTDLDEFELEMSCDGTVT
jgi:hypothetical protein